MSDSQDNNDAKPNATAENSETEEYKVGRGNPPKRTQFKPGQSGNPKGRPKGSRNFKTDLEIALKARMSVTKDGRKISMTTQQVLIAKFIEKSLNGDIRALSKLFDLRDKHLSDEEEIVKDKPLATSETNMLEDYKKAIIEADKLQSGEKAPNAPLNDGDDYG